MKNAVVILVIMCMAGIQQVFAYEGIAIDTARISVYYRYEFQKDTINHLKKQDFLVLQIGKSYTAFFSQFTLEKVTKNTSSSFKGSIIVEKPMATVVGYFLYNTIREKKIEHIESVSYRYWRYTEEQPKFDWTIYADTLEVAGYLCQKAECDYGGRHWIAWFTSEIPLSFGPYKFRGLPGMILKIEDTSKHYCFEAAYLDQEQIPIVKIKVKTEEVSKRYMFREKHKFLTNSTKYSDMVWGVDNSQNYGKDYQLDLLERDVENTKE